MYRSKQHEKAMDKQGINIRVGGRHTGLLVGKAGRSLKFSTRGQHGTTPMSRQ